MNVIAVDVGTTSVRLAIISFQGERALEVNVIASHKKDISHHQNGRRFEQSSKEIWSAICECSQECIKKCKLQKDSIRSIAFSATCSLVIQAEEKSSPTAEEHCHSNDVIMWMDHRAIEEAERITASKAKVLNQFGGVCSPEFSLAKLVWLQNHDLNRFNNANGFFELPDWLVYRCIGGDVASCARSLCCVTCKWGYDVEADCHCDLIKTLDTNIISRKIGNTVLDPGSVAGYLSSKAAKELGLQGNVADLQDKENFQPLRIAVGTSLIDAHAGMLAMLSAPLKANNINQKIETTFCSLAGTSSCHMLLTKELIFKHGIWGPYKNVVIHGYHLLEAGQSLTGKLIEMSIESHEEGKMRLKAGERMYDIISNLNEQMLQIKLQSSLHVLPTFHGNRSPLANPRLLGGVYGLTAERMGNLLEYYVATIESLIYETKLIVESLGTKLDTMLVSGGLMKNVFYMQTLADVLQCQVIRMSLEGIDFMVMGSGLVARHAALSLMNPLKASSSHSPLTKESIENIEYRQLELQIYRPQAEQYSYHEKRYLCYKEFVELSQRIDKILHPPC